LEFAENSGNFEEKMTRRFLIANLILGTVLTVNFARAQDGPTKVEGKPTKMASGLEFFDIKVGAGEVAVKGKPVSVHYTGWLITGKKFDSSLDRGKPFPFTLGAGQVIKGWDEGVAGMKVGGKRQLRIPPDLAYGSRGVGNGLIPPNSALIFDVELLEVGK
jgi:FKBP-type peptidyl-prolyl cis-trans isomerase